MSPLSLCLEVRDREVREVQSMRGFEKGKMFSISGVDNGGFVPGKEREWPLETETGPQSTASKEMGTSVLQ